MAGLQSQAELSGRNLTGEKPLSCPISAWSHHIYEETHKYRLEIIREPSITRPQPVPQRWGGVGWSKAEDCITHHTYCHFCLSSI